MAWLLGEARRRVKASRRSATLVVRSWICMRGLLHAISRRILELPQSFSLFGHVMLLPTTDDVIAFWREAGATNGSLRTTLSTRRSGSAFSRFSRRPNAATLAGWEEDAGWRARARDRARPIPAKPLPRHAARLCGGCASPRRHLTRARARLRPPCDQELVTFLYMPLCIRRIWPIRNARFPSSRRSAFRTICAPLSSIATSSRASAVSRTATRCSAERRRRKNGSYLEDGGFSG